MRVDLTPIQEMILAEWSRLYNAARPQLIPKLPPRPKNDSGITWNPIWRPLR